MADCNCSDICTLTQVVHECETAVKGAPEVMMAIQLARVEQGRRTFIVAAVAAGGTYEDQPLHGLVLHWGCVAGMGRGWEAPPAGWHTLPGKSFPAGKFSFSVSAVQLVPAIWGMW
jgi:hypothetical protein